MTILNYICTFGLTENESTIVTQKWVQVSVNSTGGTVHLFIGTGHSPCKITSMPFTFANDFKVVHWGLNSLFPFKSVLFFCRYAEAPLCVVSALCQPSYCSCFSHCVVLIRVRRHLFIYYTRETLLNHVFEDLRKTKAPNSSPSQY
jgi:hypothetical protein